MKFKGDFKKIRFFATIGLSAMAMVVATIGTFAWFQAKSSGADPRHEVTADSAGLDITGVTAYKGQFARQNDSTYDYSKAAVTAKHYLGSGDDNVDAQHTGDPLDVPANGCGYYVKGNDEFIAGNGLTGSAWSYAASKPMLTKTGKNHAYLSSVTLITGMVFDIEYHTYGILNSDRSAGVVTINKYTADWYSTVLYNKSGDNTYRLQDDGFSLIDSSVVTYSTRISVNEDISGVYDLWLNASNQLSLVEKGSASAAAIAAVEALSGFSKSESRELTEPLVKGRAPTRKSLSKNDTDVYLVGSFNSWTASDPYKFTSCDISGYVLQLYATVSAGDTFKVHNRNNWYSGFKGYCMNNFSGGGKDRDPGDYTDISCDSGKGDHYLFLLNSSGGIFIEPAPYVKGPAVNNSTNDWNTGKILMSRTGNLGEKQEVKLYSGKDFKIGGESWHCADEGYNKLKYGTAKGDFSNGTNGNLHCDRTGYYNIYLNTSWELTIDYSTLTVNIDKNGGTDGSTTSFTTNYGADLPTTLSGLPTPSSGYTFLGLYDSSSNGNKYFNADGTRAKNTWDKSGELTYILYAHWTNQYAVTLSANGGTAGSKTSVTATYGSNMPAVTGSGERPTRNGYTFAGYYDDTSGGTQYYTSTGASARTWDKTSSTTLYAHWDPNDYTVTLNVNEGKINAGDVTSYTAGVGATLPTNVTKTHYDFGGWYDNSSFTGSPVTSISTTDYGNKEYWAKWTLHHYTITLNTNGGTIRAGDVDYYTYGTGATLPTNVTKDYYDFGGWYANSSFTGSQVTSISTTDSGDKEYWAKWTLHSYSVTLNTNGGKINAGNVTSYTYESANISLPTNVTKTGDYGYGFMGWYTSSTLTGSATPTFSIPNHSSENKTFYAQWAAVDSSGRNVLYVMKPNWTDVWVHVWGSNSLEYNEKLTDGNVSHAVSGYDDVFRFVLPADATGCIFYDGEFGDGHQTANIYWDSFSASDSSGAPRGSNNDMISLSSDTTWTWRNFMGSPEPGYYVVGSKDYTGGSATPWTYSGGAAMTEVSPTYLEIELALIAGDKFQIWHATESEARADMYQWSAVSRANDPETLSIVQARGSDIEVITTGHYTIILDVSSPEYPEIMVNDAYAETKLVFSSGSRTETLMSGDGRYNSEVLERGVEIAKDSIFIVYKRSRGALSWYTGSDFDTENATNAKFATVSSSTNFSTTDKGGNAVSNDGVTGVKVKYTGFYTVYIAAGKIYIASVPTESGYYLLRNGASKGYTDASEFLTVNSNPALDTDYVAQYSNFTPGASETAEIHSYIDGVDTPYKSFERKEGVGGLTSSDVSWNPSTGVVTFGSTPVAMDIYIKKNGTVRFEKAAATNMLTLNSFSKTGYTGAANKEAFVKGSNTSLILAVEFSTSNSFSSAIDVACVSGSTYTRFTTQVTAAASKSTFLGGFSPYEKMRNSYYSSWTSTTAGYSKSLGAVSSSTDYIVYIMIDYDPTAISSATVGTALATNMKFALRSRQV